MFSWKTSSDSTCRIPASSTSLSLHRLYLPWTRKRKKCRVYVACGHPKFLRSLQFQRSSKIRLQLHGFPAANSATLLLCGSMLSMAVPPVYQTRTAQERLPKTINAVKRHSPAAVLKKRRSSRPVKGAERRSIQWLSAAKGYING